MIQYLNDSYYSINKEDRGMSDTWIITNKSKKTKNLVFFDSCGYWCLGIDDEKITNSINFGYRQKEFKFSQQFIIGLFKNIDDTAKDINKLGGAYDKINEINSFIKNYETIGGDVIKEDAEYKSFLKKIGIGSVAFIVVSLLIYFFLRRYLQPSSTELNEEQNEDLNDI